MVIQYQNLRLPIYHIYICIYQALGCARGAVGGVGYSTSMMAWDRFLKMVDRGT